MLSYRHLSLFSFSVRAAHAAQRSKRLQTTAYSAALRVCEVKPDRVGCVE
jgi:hypothetical protein